VRAFAEADSKLQTTVFRAPKDRAALEEYRDAGIHSALLGVPDASRDDILRMLDEDARLIV
jgi:hypothetical protein